MRRPIKINSSSRPSPQRQRFFARAVGACFEARASSGATVVEFYDEVGAFGISASAFGERLKAAPGDIVLRINSPGGDVFDGVAIYNELVAHNGKVRVEITGVAASAASIIAMAGDQIAIAENAFLMVHNAWGLTIGNRHDHADAEDLLGQIDKALAATYAAKTGLTLAECATMMDAETWMAGVEAKARGFATEVIGTGDAAAKFDLTPYARAPAALSQPQNAAPDISSPVELEKLLRTAGLSRRQAKAVSFGGFNALKVPDSSSEISALAARINTAAETIERKSR